MDLWRSLSIPGLKRSDRGYDMKHDALGGESIPPDCETANTPRAIDLYGRALEGRPMLWKRAVQVVPVTAFERSGRRIKSGHYVIDHYGDAVVVHCGNMRDKSVSAQFMHAVLTPYVLPRGTIESMLLGKVVVSEEQRGRCFRGKAADRFLSLTEGSV
jgi:hypothetical protein